MDETEETEEYSGTLNWADWVILTLYVPIYFFKGVVHMFEVLNELLSLQSRNIDERRDFSNAVHEAIESLNEKNED